MASPAAPTLDRPSARPLSPHLSIWRWKVHMLVSILHRATGQAMAFGAVILFVWWLAAAATGPEAYGTWHDYAFSWLGYLVAIGFTWTVFQHMMSGLRHLVMDTGAAYEIRASKRFALATLVISTALTVLLWAFILGVK